MHNTANKKGKKKKFSRRKFLVRSAVGVGVILGAGYLSRGLIRRYLAEVVNAAEAPYSGDTETPTLWFEITTDNKVILYSPKVEMGQGTFTGMAQIAADELEVDISQMKVVHADTASGNVDGFSTGGSTSISSLWQPLRELAATMREMLKQEAARLMSTEVAALSVKNGVITAGEQSMNYGEIVGAVKEWKVPDVPPLKKLEDYKFIRKPIPRVDLLEKVVGAPIFGMDAAIPGMLYGAVVRSSMVGAKYKDADTSAAENMPGVVKVVKEEDFVGVI
ncbi:MAG: molybdopterin cofactor-binding domain-containing protein [Bacteroidota bacterium]